MVKIPLLPGVLIVGSLLAFDASAQRYDDGAYVPDSRYYDDGQYRPGAYGNGPQYDYARVVRVDPVIVDDGAGRGQRCYDRAGGDYVSNNGYRDDGDYRDGDYRNDGYRDQRYGGGNEAGRQLATVIGGVAGAVLGSRVGGGDGRYLGTAMGTLVGGVAGRSIYEANTRNSGYQRSHVQVCEPVGYGQERERVAGYDVTYEYAGRTYHTRRDYHPGERIRVRVDVSAD
ncbi:glycine zipper 2TM domain-containing protein [Stenotrophomonas sp. YIM B06876]|uniref:glycine zipper 2TM domain-containing protein n=1 Tax=Stenotrophomonas sp. YIM B06876 TaxID=3060211 RepID=UPI0027395AD8|nr:glycine zipper 2TM domain-containing protein [Stenotrophomonas sp. YIM B06876]